MRCVLLDDDLDYAREITFALEKEFPALYGEIESIPTEKEFRERLESSEGLDAEFFIIDMMIQWTDQSDPELPPEEKVIGGYYRAGSRCLILTHNKYPGKPIIMQSALTSEQIRSELNSKGISEEEEGIQIVRKTGVEDLVDLFSVVEKTLGHPSR